MLPLQYIVDENISPDLLRAIRKSAGELGMSIDVVRVGDMADLPSGSADPDILIWAEREDRVLVSFDHNSLPDHLRDHLAAGRHSPGIFIIDPRRSAGEIAELLAVGAGASEEDEWRDPVEWIK